MRIAGARLRDGTMAWLDAGDLNVGLLDEARAEIGGAVVTGNVYVAPEQVLAAPDHVDGVLIATRSIDRTDGDCGRLPGADLPVLGQRALTGTVRGMIVALDPVRRRVTIAGPDGESIESSVDDIVVG